MLSSSMLSLAANLMLASSALGATVSYTFNVANGNVNPAGTARSSILVNNAMAPLIKAQKDDTFAVTVADKLNDPGMLKSTSIHWHGLHMYRTSAMDGAVGVTQCPITTNSSFTYRFAGAGQTGTYWYHSHYSTQYCDGLRGPMIIYDANDPYKSQYDVDDDSTVITLADWYNGKTQQIFQPGGVPPPPNATLINNKGRESTTSTAPLSVVNVTKDKRYRFRIINMACETFYTFSMEGHKLTVIEADGILHKSVTVDSLVIHPGQRYSVIVTANQAVGNYWIRAAPHLGPQGFQNGMNSAILNYAGVYPAQPSGTSQTIGTQLNEASLAPLVNPGAPGGSGAATVSYNLVMGFNAGFFTVNGVQFKSPSIPVLLQILNGNTDATKLLPQGSVYGLPPNAIVQLSIPGGSFASPHPFHLHGHSFDIIRGTGQKTYNYANPPRRDVVNIGNDPTDNVTIRFKADNPGPWYFHCHNDWHLVSGMAVVFAEDAATVKSQGGGATDEWKNLCPKYNALPAGDR